MTFGGKLKKLRTDSGLTQDELEEKSTSHVLRSQNGNQTEVIPT